MPRKPERLALATILLLAAGLRLRHIDFGLPSLNDPDEPVFIMTALDMLREGRLNPGWFGHPATLLFYLLAMMIAGVAATGLALGRWASTDGFVAAVFADPATIVLPMRLLMAAFGIASVWMTWRLGRRVAGAGVGLAAALLVATNTLHVELSQVIRTDMLATLLMGWAMLQALAIADTGRTRAHVLAGMAAGLACATKWPAVLVLVAPLAAGLWRVRENPRAWRLLPLTPAVALVTLLTVSPFLLMDWQTVVRDLGGEARPIHPGATGQGLLGNLVWYVRYPILDSFGPGGLALLAIGMVSAVRRRAAALVMLPTLSLTMIALCAQSLVWARWMVPLLPIMAVLIAIGLARLLALVPVDKHRQHALLVTLLLLGGAMTGTTVTRQAIRDRDPRQDATAWIRRHVPAGHSVLIEHAAFDLLRRRGRLLFPLGSAGCINVRDMLARAPSHRKINGLRTGRAVVDLGHVEPDLLATCAADILVLSNYHRYRREPTRFATERANYEHLLRDYRLDRHFRSVRPDGDPVDVSIYRRRGA